jgi:hypothetical protein
VTTDRIFKDRPLSRPAGRAEHRYRKPDGHRQRIKKRFQIDRYKVGGLLSRMGTTLFLVENKGGYAWFVGLDAV